MFHVHLYRTAQDCDGRIDSSWVQIPDDHEKPLYELYVNEVGYAVAGNKGDVSVSTIAFDLSDSEFGYRTYVNYATEEGFVEMTIETCDCPDAAATYRDHSAEAMGY